jgi:uncharacterized protein YndB with AHSA1/START domain
MIATAEPSTTTDREMVITRRIAAPQAMVFRAWTDPEQIGHWFGPQGYTTTTHEIDVRPGGVWRFIMHDPDGTDYPNKIVYREITPFERLVFDHGADDDGASEPFLTTVTFVEQGDQTEVTLRAVFPTVAERDAALAFGAVEGGNQTLARLDEFVTRRLADVSPRLDISLPNDLDIVTVCRFNAPRQLVFDAWTKCEHLKHWWGPRYLTLAECEIDLRPGGAYHFVQRAPDGGEHAFYGVYREILPPERFACTFVYAGLPEHEVTMTVVFDEHDGKTTMTETMHHASREARDGNLNSGMESGAQESVERLAEHLSTLV